MSEKNASSFRKLACSLPLVLGPFLALAQTSPRWLTVMPLPNDCTREIAEDIRAQKRDTLVEAVVWSCTLVPEGGEKPVDKAAIYAERYRKMHELLRGSGVREGILFQATVGHGWTPAQRVEWQKMVSRNGREYYKFCPMDPRFLSYIADQTRQLAALKPDFFMVDDDTRFITGFDACFCPLHLAGFTSVTNYCGVAWTRESLAAALAKDEGLAEKWDDYLRDTMAPLLETIRAAFPPEVPGEFCCAAHDTHQARHMAKILAGPDHPLVVRLNNSLYQKDALRDVLLRRLSETAWQMNEIGPGVTILSETDPCPQNRYSMDATRLLHHAVMSHFMGCRGAKLWLTRLGNVHEVASGRAYREAFAAKNGWIRTMDGINPTRTGVVIPLPKKRRVTQLKPGWCSVEAFDWGTAVFGRMGIPYRYGSDAAADEVVALNAQTVSYLTDAELERYLSGACLLDGGAAEAVTARGFGRLIGIEAKRWKGATICAERLSDGTLYSCTVNGAVDLSACDPAAEVATRFLNRPSGISSELTELAPGSCFFTNAAGGRICVYASFLYPYPDLSHVDWYSETRKRDLLAALRRLGGGRLPGGLAYAGDAELICWTAVEDGRTFVILDNLLLDDVAKPAFLTDATPRALRRLADDGTWTDVPFAAKGDAIVLDLTLRTYRPEVLEIVK